MHFQNLTGRRVAYLRSQKKWTHDKLATKLQCEGVDISRLSLARMEWGVTKISDTVLAGLQKIFCLPLIQFFPKEIQDLDAMYAAQLPNPVSKEKPSKCRKLTKRPKNG